MLKLGQKSYLPRSWSIHLKKWRGWTLFYSSNILWVFTVFQTLKTQNVKINLQSTYSQIACAVREPSGGWCYRESFPEEVNSVWKTQGLSQGAYWEHNQYESEAWHSWTVLVDECVCDGTWEMQTNDEESLGIFNSPEILLLNWFF